MGRVIAQDLKHLAARRLSAIHSGQPVTPVLLIVDEFAALRESRQLADLLLQAREARMAMVVGTQYLPSLLDLRVPLLQAGLVIAHRLATEDAEAVANEFGTEATQELTRQHDFETGAMRMGSFRRVQSYVLNPNDICNLGVGQAAARVPRARPHHAIVQIAPPP